MIFERVPRKIRYASSYYKKIAVQELRRNISIVQVGRYMKKIVIASMAHCLIGWYVGRAHSLTGMIISSRTWLNPFSDSSGMPNSTAHAIVFQSRTEVGIWNF